MVEQPSLASRSAPTFWTGQATHFIGLSLLLLLTWIAWQFVGNPSPVLFRFTNNGMYLYAFFLFWAVAFAFNSLSATIVAGYSHVYIWVHYYATEKPDMKYLYRGSPIRGTG